jgi:hypothetical protein
MLEKSKEIPTPEFRSRIPNMKLIEMLLGTHAAVCGRPDASFFSAIAEHFILLAHNQIMNFDLGAWLLLVPSP